MQLVILFSLMLNRPDYLNCLQDTNFSSVLEPMEISILNVMFQSSMLLFVFYSIVLMWSKMCKKDNSGKFGCFSPMRHTRNMNLKQESIPVGCVQPTRLPYLFWWLPLGVSPYRSGPVNSKSFVSKDFLRNKSKYELTIHFKHKMIGKNFTETSNKVELRIKHV